MNLLVISRNENIFNENDPAFKEYLACSTLVDQIHIIVLTKKALKEEEVKQIKNINNKLFIYPTNSTRSIFYFFDAIKIAKAETVNKFYSIIDLISGEDTMLCGFISYYLSRKYKRNFIINIYKNIFNPDQDVSFIKKAFRHDVVHFLLKRAHGIRVLSQLIGEIVYSQYPKLQDRIFVLPFLADIEKLQEIESSISIRKQYPNFNIIFIHVAEQVKFRTLLKLRNIMKVASQRYPLSGLVVLGNIKKRFWHPWFFSRLPKNIVFERISDKVHSYYKTANVFIDTSSESDPGGPITEAALVGCPIVASKTKASVEAIKDGENGFIADPNDVQGFFKKIIDILETPGLREAMRFAKYNISDSLYGRTNEEYYSRIVDIWNICKTPKENEQTPIKKAANPDSPKPYPVITMNLIKKVQAKVINNKHKQTFADRLYKDESVDLDSAKSSIEEILAEIQ